MGNGMANKSNKSARGRNQDRARVDGGQDDEVRYEAKKAGTSKSAVKKAAKNMGTSRKRVTKTLQRLKSGRGRYS